MSLMKISFIFLIHVERINKTDLENQYQEQMDLIRKKMLVHTLSNLAGYYQIFIDDINGQNYFDDENKIISLDRILKMKMFLKKSPKKKNLELGIYVYMT